MGSHSRRGHFQIRAHLTLHLIQNLEKWIHTSWISRGVVGGLLSNITFSALVNLKGCNAFKNLWTVSSDWWLHGVSWRYRIVWNVSLILSIVNVCVCVHISHVMVLATYLISDRSKLTPSIATFLLTANFLKQIKYL